MSKILILGAAALMAGALTTAAPMQSATAGVRERPCITPPNPFPYFPQRWTPFMNFIWTGPTACTI